MMPYKNFVAGEEALAADVNSYLMSQTISRHASASARSSAISAPTKGQMTVLDTDVFVQEVHTGSAWVPMPWYFTRFVHQTGFGTFASAINANIDFPSMTFPRLCGFTLDFEIHITLQSGSGGCSCTFQAVNNPAGLAPATAPVSMFNLNPFLGITIPFKALYRNAPPNTNIAPRIAISTGTNGGVINVNGISGNMHFFPPGSEA